MRHVDVHYRCLFSRDQSLRRWSALVVAGFAFLLASTSQDAHASCGDYVMVGGANRHGLDHSSQSSPLNSRRVPTCSGPHCQRQVPPLPAPKHLVLSGPHESACPMFADRSQTDNRSRRVNEPALLASQAVVSPLDRPPRASNAVAL